MRNGNFMKNTRVKKKPVSAEAIARMADKGTDVSRFFTNSGQMRKLIQRVNVDFTASMLEELERAARDLNISRQAVIKTLIRQGLDQSHRARASRARSKRS
jgi:Ribbon-helix-helix protein, copG family